MLYRNYPFPCRWIGVVVTMIVPYTIIVIAELHRMGFYVPQYV